MSETEYSYIYLIQGYDVLVEDKPRSFQVIDVLFDRMCVLDRGGNVDEIGIDLN